MHFSLAEHSYCYIQTKNHLVNTNTGQYIWFEWHSSTQCEYSILVAADIRFAYVPFHLFCMMSTTDEESQPSQSEREDIDFEFTPGLRSDSELLFTKADGQLFRKCSKYKSGYYYRCRVPKCGARVLFDSETQKCYVKGGSGNVHNHDSDQRSLYEEIVVKTKIKKECLAVSSLSSGSEHISQIFNRVVREWVFSLFVICPCASVSNCFFVLEINTLTLICRRWSAICTDANH